jgi:hypothetical protein
MDAKLIGLLTASDNEAIAAVTMELYNAGYHVITDNVNYVFGVPGTDTVTPVMLMAHIDTVRKPEGVVLPGVYFDTLYNVNASECGCLGADDRAGVYICLEIISKLDAKPYVLFTTGEEIGGVGVKAFLSSQHPERNDVPEEFWSGKTILEPYLDDIYAVLQYDRQGFNSVVAYGSARLQTELIDKAIVLGYCLDWGTTSDSRNITETHGVAHLNLSAGFIHQHGFNEMLLLPALDFAINNGIVLAESIDKPYRLAKEQVFSAWPKSSFGYYPPKEEDKPLPDDLGITPTCDICGKHRTVEYIDHADALVCKKCIRRAGGTDKITINTMDDLVVDLELKRRISRQGNLPFVSSCPVCGNNKEVYPMKDGVFYCATCDMHFYNSTPPEGAYTWVLEDSTQATFKYFDRDKGEVCVSSSEEMCPLDNCEMCGKLWPSKALSYYTNQETHEVELVVCDDCNAIDPPRKRQTSIK